MNSDSVRLLFYLPNLKSYQDRAHLVGQLAKKLSKVVLLVSRLDMDPKRLHLDSKLEIVVLSQGFRFPGRTAFYAAFEASRLVKKHRINVVHDTFAHLLFFFLFPKKKNKACLLVTSLYNLSEWDFRKFIAPLYGKRVFFSKDLRLWLLRIPLQRMICSYADHVVLQAPGLKKRLLEFLPLKKEKISWFPNNITGLFKLKEESFFLDKCQKSKIRLLFVGAFSIAKGGLLLLSFLKKAKEQSLSVEVTLIGGFSKLDQEVLERKIEECHLEKTITIHERLNFSELKNHYFEQDWLFHCTSVDGSPRVVLEALSHGLPVIGSRHPGISVLDPKEEYILFFDSNKEDSILQTLISHKKNPQNYFNRVQKGWKAVQEHFTSDSVSEKYRSFYEDLLEKK